jgi:hypothetical protein
MGTGTATRTLPFKGADVVYGATDISLFGFFEEVDFISLSTRLLDTQKMK